MKVLISALFAAVTLPAHAVKISYSYDAAGRLTAANYDGASRTAYAYDKNGNLLSRTNTTNVIPALAGTYNGLLSNASPDISNIGPISLKVGSNGSFSGKVILAGSSYSFAGVFAANGSTGVITIDRKPPLNDLSLTLALDVTNGTGQITGSVTDTLFTSTIQIDRAAYDTKSNLLPAGLIGKYTALLLPTEMTAGIPQGDGYATVSVNNSGGIMLAGKLANNVGITHSSTFVDGSLWPLFVSLHSSKGFLSGLVTFETDPGNSDFDGYLSWVKPATTGTFHPNGFTTNLTLIGSKWEPPAKGQRAITVRNTSPNLSFNASQGNLAAPIFLNVTLDAANKFVIPADPSKLKLSLTTSSGVIMGSITDAGKTRTLSGVLLQDWNSGSGFFPGATESGVFELEPLP
jgi:YD repeat-containing protein